MYNCSVLPRTQSFLVTRTPSPEPAQESKDFALPVAHSIEGVKSIPDHPAALPTEAELKELSIEAKISQSAFAALRDLSNTFFQFLDYCAEKLGFTRRELVNELYDDRKGCLKTLEGVTQMPADQLEKIFSHRNAAYYLEQCCVVRYIANSDSASTAASLKETLEWTAHSPYSNTMQTLRLEHDQSGKDLLKKLFNSNSEKMSDLEVNKEEAQKALQMLREGNPEALKFCEDHPGAVIEMLDKIPLGDDVDKANRVQQARITLTAYQDIQRCKKGVAKCDNARKQALENLKQKKLSDLSSVNERFQHLVSVSFIHEKHTKARDEFAKMQSDAEQRKRPIDTIDFTIFKDVVL